MGTIARISGFLLVIGTLLFSAGTYTSFRRDSYQNMNQGASEGAPLWFGLAIWVGIALIVMGIVAVLAMLIGFVKSILWSLPPTPVMTGIQTTEIAHNSEDMGGLFNRIIQLEYANLMTWFHCGSYGDEMAEKLRHISQEDLRHFVKAAVLAQQWGSSNPIESKLPDYNNYFRKQLLNQIEREKSARQLYQIASESATTESLRQELKALEAGKEAHIKLLKDMLSGLASPD